MANEEITISGVSRQAFILRGAMAAGAVYGAGAVGPFVGRALAQGGGGDVDILNFALTLEYLEAAFYKKATGLNLSTKAAKLAKELADHEAQHVTALKKAIKSLGGKPVKSPRFSFPITDEASFLKLAQTLEDTGVSAYNGAAPSLESKDILGAAGAMRPPSVCCAPGRPRRRRSTARWTSRRSSRPSSRSSRRKRLPAGSGAYEASLSGLRPSRLSSPKRISILPPRSSMLPTA
jgi:hypothetical protein